MTHHINRLVIQLLHHGCCKVMNKLGHSCIKLRFFLCECVSQQLFIQEKDFNLKLKGNFNPTPLFAMSNNENCEAHY